jgi:3-hydroxybutyryl-CoA dehydrogenase
MKVGIIGAGVMGRGIAQVSAMAGHQVVLFDINDDVLKEATKNVTLNLNKALELGKIDDHTVTSTHTRLQYTNSIADRSNSRKTGDQT